MNSFVEFCRSRCLVTMSYVAMSFRQMSFVAVNYGQDEFCRRSHLSMKFLLHKYCTLIYPSNINILFSNQKNFMSRNFCGCIVLCIMCYVEFCVCVMGVNISLPEAIWKIIKTLHNASGEFNVDKRFFQKNE